MKYIINLIDKKFLFEIFLDIVVKKISTLMIIRGIDVNMHNVNEYVKLQIYLFDKNDIIRIKREFHIVENLVVKTFIDIDIMKSKGMILDIEKNIMIIELYKNIQISFIFINQRSSIRVMIFNNNQKRLTIFSHFNVAIFVTDLKNRSFKLLNDRDFLFKSQKLDILLIYAHIVDYNILKIFIKNDIDYVMSLSRKIKLRMIIDYEAARCYVIDFLKHDLIMKASKRSFN